MKCKSKRWYNCRKYRCFSAIFSLSAACCLSACSSAQTAMNEMTETETRRLSKVETETESDIPAFDFSHLQTELKLLRLRYNENFTFAWNIPESSSLNTFKATSETSTKSDTASMAFSETEIETEYESELLSSEAEIETEYESEPFSSEAEQPSSEADTSTEEGSQASSSGANTGTENDFQQLFSEADTVSESETETDCSAETDFTPVTLRTLKDYRELRVFPLPPLPLTIQTLEAKLTHIIGTYSGQWSVYVKNLTTEDAFIINDVPMKSASVMKLFIMGAVYEAIDNGELERTQEVVDLLNNMITYSSNTDSNKLLSLMGGGDFAAGIEKVNQYIASHSYSEETHEYNGFNDSSTILDSGHSNQVSAKDCGKLLEQVYHRTFASRKVCNEIETMMLKQDTRYKIPAGLPEDVEVGNKTGEMDTVENDVAVIYGDKSDYILCILSSDWNSKDEAIRHIAEIASITYDFFDDDAYYLSVSETDADALPETSEISTEAATEHYTSNETEAFSQEETKP